MFIFDIYVATLKIKDTSNKFTNVQDLLYDYTKWDSVIREFEIIGEASKHLLKSNLIHKDYQKIVNFRNQITHEYFGIDQDVVWLIIYTKLDALEQTIIEFIRKMEPNLKQELIEAFINDNSYLDFVVKELEILKGTSE
ncbi:MAG TPA: DUF86 domain-containing protein [Sulfurimonas autotrophica]|nr:DUF86 domain-containing protein [Sulfurimonas autotrophica]